MKTTLNVLLLLITFLFSCKNEKEDEVNNITLNMNQSGTVTIKVLNKNSVGFKGAKVRIASIDPAYVVIYYDSTDSQGICNVGKVLQGYYSCDVFAKSGKMSYSFSKSFQVIAGDDKIINTTPFLNIGSALVQIVDNSSTPIINVNVALIPHSAYSGVNYTYNELIEEAYFIEKTDSNGWVTFKDAPTGSEYSIFVYINSNKYDYPLSNNYIYVSASNPNKYTIKVNL